MSKIEQTSDKAQIGNSSLGVVSERYSKDDIKRYDDGWWITKWREERKCRIKIVGPFENKWNAEHDREILNAR